MQKLINNYLIGFSMPAGKYYGKLYYTQND